ncbi:MAG: hypothetical protein GY756_28045 [bacterium]|nr:hypothetical protein [bacterium]
MAVKQLNTKEYYRLLSLIFYALLAGQIIFACVGFYFVKSGNYIPEFSESKTLFSILVGLIVIEGISVGNYVYKRKISKIKYSVDLKLKMSEYRIANIIRFAFIEASSIFSIILYILSGYTVLLIGSTVTIGYFIFIRPTAEQTLKELKLNTEEKNKLNDPKEIIAEIESK